MQELQVNSDAKSELMLRLKLNSKRFIREELPGGDAATSGLSLQVEKEPEDDGNKPGQLVVNIKRPEPARPAAVAAAAPVNAPAAAPAARAQPMELSLSLEEKPEPPAKP